MLPETLIEKYSCDGVYKYLDQFDGYDELYEYLKPLTPYLNRAMKKKVAAYIDDKDKFDSDDKKELKKVLTRAKTQNEIARDFVRDREHPIWYSEALGLFDYTGAYWKQTNDYLIRKEFEDYYDTRNSEEKAIVDKIKELIFISSKLSSNFLTENKKELIVSSSLPISSLMIAQ